MTRQRPRGHGRAGAVVVVGSVNVDTAVRVARLPGPGETVLGHGVRRSGGGKGANQAVAAARSGGADTAMVGRVGDDADGEAMRSALEGDGIDCSALAVEVGVPTGLALITVDEVGENSIVVAAGANDRVIVDGPARTLLAGAAVVVAQLEVPQSVVLDAARARGDGALLLLNAAPWAPLRPELMAEVDVLIVNEHEARGLTGCDELGAAQDRLLEQVPAVLVTLGSAGARLCRRGREPLEVPAPSVRAVDTTGAGDTFCGVFAAELAAGSDDATALIFAAAAASLTVEQAGAQDSLPTRAQVDVRAREARGSGHGG